MFSDTWQEQIASLRQLFTRARLIGLVFHPIKSEFLLTEVCWFGRDIGHGEVRPPVDYIGRLLLRTKPATYTDLREWCGGLNWVIAHIPNASVIMRPVYDLHRTSSNPKRTPKAKDVISWTPEADAAFDEICRALSDPKSLAIPDVARPFGIYTDASRKGWGAVLMQRDQHTGKWRPCGFVSGAWKSKRESSASARLLEANGLRHALRHWAWCVRNGHAIEVFSDHRSLSQRIDPRTTDSDLQRLVIGELKAYHLRVEYVPGGDNWLADALSRFHEDDSTHAS
jgi:hypothetical protein